MKKTVDYDLSYAVRTYVCISSDDECVEISVKCTQNITDIISNAKQGFLQLIDLIVIIIPIMSLWSMV